MADDTGLGAERTVELPGGITLDYHDLGSGRPVVFLHGLVLNAAFWHNVAPPLASEFRCVVPTLPLGGHRRALPAEVDLSPPGIARLVLEFLEALDLRDAVLVSNDTATALTQILLTTDSERVGAVVLTSGDAFRHFLPWQFRHLQLAAWVPRSTRLTAKILQRPAARRSALGFGLLTERGFADDVSAGFVSGLQRDAGVRRDLVKVLRGISTRHTREAARRLSAFTKPVLIVWAGNEKLFPVKLAHRLATLLPQARLELVEGSRTYLPQDQPERLVELIREFLAGSGDAGPSDA